MLNMILFITVVFVSFIVVRIGAIALHLTGLDWRLAKFQALSCFTGTGFTTKEAELIVSHAQRRKIASFLMVMGNAGLVTLIASVANSLRPRRLELPFLNVLPEWLIPWMNIIIIIGVVYALYRFMNSKAARNLTIAMRRKLVSRYTIGRIVSFEELTFATGGWGVLRIPVSPQSPLVEKALSDSGLRAENILLLAIVRDSDTIANPTGTTRIQKGDELLCFGQVDAMRKSTLFQSKDEP